MVLVSLRSISTKYNNIYIGDYGLITRNNHNSSSDDGISHKYMMASYPIMYSEGHKHVTDILDRILLLQGLFISEE